MKRTVILLSLWLCAAPLWSQTPEPPPISDRHAMGEVITIDAPKSQIVLKTGAGDVAVLFDPNTKFLRIPPGETNLQKAEAIALSDVSTGDRLLARGKVSDDKKSISARQVIVISQTAIAQKRERERQEWDKRGIAGTVTALDPSTKEITVMIRSSEGRKPIVIEAGGSIVFHRYAPDSVKFADALPSSLNDLKVGDQLRALGDKSADGSRFKPEMIVFGSFVMAGGLVTAVDPQKGELTINNVATGQPLTVVINQASLLRRLPSDFARMLAQRSSDQNSGAPQSRARQQAVNRPDGASNGDIQRTLEQLPPMPVADLLPGDMILVSSTKGVDPSRVTAITLAAGVEPLFRPRQEGSQPQGPGTSIGFGDFMDFGVGLPQ